MDERFTITPQDVEDAKDGGVGFDRIYSLLQPVISRCAARAAREVNGDQYMREELEAEAAAYLWDLVITFDGSSAGNLAGSLVTSLMGKIKDARQALATPGSDQRAIKRFLHHLRSAEADGDPAVAERLCREDPNKSERLSPDRAYAARCAWEHKQSLDTTPGNPGVSRGTAANYRLSDRIADRAAVIPGEEKPTSERSRAIKAAQDTLATLTEMQRDVIVASLVQELPGWEIQELLGLTPKQYKNYRAKGKDAFYTRFPYEDVYGAPKPPMALEAQGTRQRRQK